MNESELADAPALRLDGPGDDWMVWEPVTSGLPKGLGDIVRWHADLGDARPSLGDLFKHFQGSDWLEHVVLAAEGIDNYQIVRYPEFAASASGLEMSQGACLTDAYPAAWKFEILKTIRATASSVVCWKVSRRVKSPGRLLQAEFWRLSFPFGATAGTVGRLAIILYPVNDDARQVLLNHLKAKNAPIPQSLTGKGMLGDAAS